ncbi:MAG: glycosyltransferase family 4 protein [Planctomycetota bacterium]|nr:glycosyltransferase family 4 protein [Planctomycetota bacterium]
MRIAMIGSRGIPAREGGVERVVEQITGELVALGHEVLVYCRRHYVGSAPAPVAGRAIPTPGLAGKHLDTFTHTGTAMLDVLRRRVDVVHIHSPGPALWSWIPAAAGLGIVFTVHAPDWRRAKWSLPAKGLIRAGLACGMRFADAVTTVSGPLATELGELYDREIITIPNATCPARLQPPETISRWRLEPDGYGLYVGRIVPEKRLDLLLRAWTNAGGGRPLVVVGDADENRYARACKKLAGPNVMFVGRQHGKVLAGLYSHAAMVIQPSVLEGMSLVLLEAAAYGRCILAADIPENRRIMGEAILYFQSDDIDELRGQIRGWLSKDTSCRSELGMKARSVVSEVFSWPEAASALESVYLRVVQER